MYHDPWSVEYWQQHQVSYSKHAFFRAKQRGIPVIDLLTPDAKLADLERIENELYCILVKIPRQTPKDFDWFLILNPQGVVVTVFRKDPEQMRQWVIRRNRFKHIGAHLYNVFN